MWLTLTENWLKFSPRQKLWKWCRYLSSLTGINSISFKKFSMKNEKEMKWYSRILVGLISSNIWAVNLLTEYSNDADKEDKVHLWRIFKCHLSILQCRWDLELVNSEIFFRNMKSLYNIKLILKKGIAARQLLHFSIYSMFYVVEECLRYASHNRRLRVNCNLLVLDCGAALWGKWAFLNC